MTNSVEQRLVQLEKQFWQSMKDKDPAAAANLSAETCILTGAQGVAGIDRQTLARMLAGATWTIEDFEISDVHVQELTEDVAIIGYKVREKLTVDGKPLELEAADASTWVRKNGEWLCALHTESVLGDPFGRDRGGR